MEFSFVFGLVFLIVGVKLNVIVFFLRVVVNVNEDLIDIDFWLYLVVREEDFFKEMVFFGVDGLRML